MIYCRKQKLVEGEKYTYFNGRRINKQSMSFLFAKSSHFEAYKVIGVTQSRPQRFSGKSIIKVRYSIMCREHCHIRSFKAAKWYHMALIYLLCALLQYLYFVYIKSHEWKKLSDLKRNQQKL